jgi:single-strand DNA-binding protein
MNLLAITGNIGRDAETRHAASGAAVCSFSVAVKSGYGEREKTIWVKCILFGKRAEGGLVQYLTKGQQVAVTGELSVAEWDDKTSGEKKYQVELAVNSIDLVGGKQHSHGSSTDDGFGNPPSTGAFPGDDSVPF